MNIVKEVPQFITEVRQELGKVAWSTRQELMDSTLVILAVTAIVAVFIGLVDLFLSKVLSFVFS